MLADGSQCASTPRSAMGRQGVLLLADGGEWQGLEAECSLNWSSWR